MKKKLLWVVLSLSFCVNTPITAANNEGGVAMAAGRSAPRKPQTKLKTNADSVCYAIGVDLSTYLNEASIIMGDDFNKEIILAGINESLAGNGAFDDDEGYYMMYEYFTFTIPNRNLEESLAFLMEVERMPNVVRSHSGLLYEIIEPGDGAFPTYSDEVLVTYTGYLKNGEIFDSSMDEPVLFNMSTLILGMSEGLSYIGKGGKIRLWIPSELGYGENGVPGRNIRPNDALVFEVDIIEILRPQEIKPKDQ